MMSVEFIKELEGWQGQACLVRGAPRKYFIVSSVDVMYSGPETLVFRAFKNGEVRDWAEVAGGRGRSRQEAIDDLENRLRKSEI